MKKKVLLVFIIFLSLFIPVFSSGESISCSFRDGTCNTGESAFLYANKFFSDSSGEVLSSNVATSIGAEGYYNKVLCCSSPYGNLNVEFKPYTGVETCNSKGIDLFYLTDSSNARVAIGSQRYDAKDLYGLDPSKLVFNSLFYNTKSCVYIPENFGSFDVIVSDKDYSKFGHACMFKVSSLVNGLVSSCSATFDVVNNKYPYTVWGKLEEDVSSLQCSIDCTSKLDGRVYFACSQKINSCSNVPRDCNGALLDSYVDSLSDSSKEIKCSSPWNIERSKVFTDEKLEVQVLTDVTTCENLIAVDYPVKVNNQQVLLKIYICEE